jgi:hypothetical protein
MASRPQQGALRAAGFFVRLLWWPSQCRRTPVTSVNTDCHLVLWIVAQPRRSWFNRGGAFRRRRGLAQLVTGVLAAEQPVEREAQRGDVGVVEYLGPGGEQLDHRSGLGDEG